MVQHPRHRLRGEDFRVVVDDLGNPQVLGRRLPVVGQVIAAAGKREEDLDAPQIRVAGGERHIERPEPGVDLLAVHFQQAAGEPGSEAVQGGFQQVEIDLAGTVLFALFEHLGHHLRRGCTVDHLFEQPPVFIGHRGQGVRAGLIAGTHVILDRRQPRGRPISQAAASRRRSFPAHGV